MAATAVDPSFTPAQQDGLGATTDQLDSIYGHPLGTRSSFRLIRIVCEEEEDGSTLDAIVCNLEIANLENLPAYDTISYSWGESSDMKTILLNGESVSIRVHLWEMLSRLHRRKWPDLLWVDLLCIRQDSIEDKNDQVAKIGRIFAGAQTVLAWVGLDTDDSLQFTTLLLLFDNYRRTSPTAWIELMDAIIEGTENPNMVLMGIKERKEFLLLAGYTVDKSSAAYESLLRDIQSSPPEVSDPSTTFKDIAEMCILRHKFQQSLIKFMSRDYFFRTWVRQELILAKEVYLFCGDAIISEAAFWPGTQFIVELITRDLEYIKLQEDIEMDGYMVRQWTRTFLHDNAILNCQKHRKDRNDCMAEQKPWGITLPTLTGLSKQTKCKDPRDKIYALHSLLHPSETLSGFRIDYNLSRMELFRRLLPYCGTAYGAPIDANEAFTLGELLNIDSRAMLQEAIRVADFEKAKTVDSTVERTIPVTVELKLLGTVIRVDSSNVHENRPTAASFGPKHRYQRIKAIAYRWGGYQGEIDTYTIDADEEIRAADLLWQLQTGGVMIISRPVSATSTESDVTNSSDIMLPFRTQMVYGTIALPDEEPHEGQHNDCFDCPREVARHETGQHLHGLTFHVSGNLPISSSWVTAPKLEQKLGALHINNDVDDDGDEDLENDIDWDEEYGDEDEDWKDSDEDDDIEVQEPKVEPVGQIKIPFEMFADLYAYAVLTFELVEQFRLETKVSKT